MDYNLIIPEILCEIFCKNEQLNKSVYITFYSKIYSIVNCLDKGEDKQFSNCISKYIKTIITSLFSEIDSNVNNYFNIYENNLEKAKLADKIFLYYQNEKCKIDDLGDNQGVISYFYNNHWDEYILTKYYPFILEDIEDINKFNPNIFEKIEKYSYHLNKLNNELNTSFKYRIFEIIKTQKKININKILELLEYYDKILNIFDDNYSKQILKKNMQTLITENETIIFEEIISILKDIQISLINKDLCSCNDYDNYNDIHKIIDYLNNSSINKYRSILLNILKQEKYVDINILIKNLNIAEFMINKFYPNNFNNQMMYSEFKDDNEIIKNFSNENILEKSIENISDNFNNNFNLEFVKFINKNINNISYLKNINVIINLLKEKETFTVYYKKALKMRLLDGRISNINNEMQLLNILVKNNNLLDVSRMLVMIKDYQMSITYSKEFNNLFNKNAFVNLTTYDMWGITPNTYEDELLSKNFVEELKYLKNDFKTYHLLSNESKNVKFVDNISTCFIDFNNVELECNYLQADLLYMFNEHEYIDLNKTIINKACVQSLLKPKILLKKDSKLYINDNFRYSKPNLKVYKLYKYNIETNSKSKSKIDNDLKRLIFQKEEYIDSSIMMFLKKYKENYFEKANVFNHIYEKLKSKFTIDNEIYLRRIKYLEDNCYLEIVENKIRYLN